MPFRQFCISARRRDHFVDAPVTGSALVAAEAKLIFWVGFHGGPTW